MAYSNNQPTSNYQKKIFINYLIVNSFNIGTIFAFLALYVWGEI